MSSDTPAGRCIRLHVSVPGPPETVWQAVATAAGISAWFVPTRTTGDEGAPIEMSFGPGLDETGRIVVSDPPRRFTYEAPTDGDRRLLYDFRVEPRGDGCVVQLINSGFGDGAQWDAMYDGMIDGWSLFLESLRLHLSHFPGQTAASILVDGSVPGPGQRAWATLAGGLGLPAVEPGRRVGSTGDKAPRLAGSVHSVAEGTMTLLLTEPGPGIGLVSTRGSGDTLSASVYLYLYGPDAENVAASAEPAWRAWMAEHFGAAPDSR